MKCLFKIGFFASIIFLFFSCGGNGNRVVEKQDTINYKNSFVKVNKKLVKTEDEQINDLINRYGWKMNQTGTGLRYMIYKKGSGQKAGRMKTAKINYSVSLITGDVCYSSKEEGPKDLLIGKSGEISGLEEGILLLRVGDKAKLIIPSHLAYGLLGDENKIPKRATLVYDIELLEIK